MTSARPAPVPNPVSPFWLTEPDRLANHRSTAELPPTCDVLIIGSGYSGVATAYYLFDGNPNPPSIVMLEAREACSGATGRNGGHFKPDLLIGCAKYAKLFGTKAAVDVCNFEAAQVREVKALIEKENIDCDFQLTRAVDVFVDEGVAKETEDIYRTLRSEGTANLSDIHFTPKKDAEAISGVKGAYGCFSFTAGHVWPYKMVMHLLNLAVEKGMNLQTTTPVIQVSETPDENGLWTATTPRGSVRAKYVVFATNGYTAGVAPQFADKIIPIRGICSRIVIPPPKQCPHLPNTYSLRWNGPYYDYLIPRADGSIIVGGARQDYLHELKNWYGVFDDSCLIEPAKNYFDGYMQRHYRGWEETGAYTDKVWTGIMGYTSDLLPHIGSVPNKPGQLILAGFGGHGMPRILLCAQAIAEMIVTGKTIEETGVPSPFWTGDERMKSTRNSLLDGIKHD